MIELGVLSDRDVDEDTEAISKAAKKPTVAMDTDHQTLLFDELSNFAEGQAKRIALHVDNGANVNFLYEVDKHHRDVTITTLHVLFDAFSRSDVDDETKQQSLIESLRTLIHMGSDPTAVDHRRRPVLQAAVANSCPLECLEILLSAPGVSVGVECRDEGSVLHALLCSKFPFGVECVEYLIDKGADLEKIHVKRSPLDEMASLDEDKAMALIGLVERKRPDLLYKHADSMFRSALEFGRLETVKLLLKKGATVSGATSTGDGAPLLFLPVRSRCSPFEKFSLLLRLKVDIKATDSKSRNAVHIAAECGRFRIMKRAMGLGVSHLDVDADGCSPIHLVSRSNYGDPSDRLECLNYLIENDSPVNSKNKRNESPLFLALQRGATKFVVRLVRAGATLADSKLKSLQYDEVTLLNDTQVILVAPKPLDMMLRLGALFTKCAQHDESHRDDHLSMSKDMERLAVEMMIRAKWTANDIVSDSLTYAIEAEQKLFISSPPVQEKIKFYWYGESGEMKWRQYMYKVPLFLLKTFFLPFLLIFLLPGRQCDYRSLPREWMQTVGPCISYVGNAVAYLLFVVLLIANVSLKSHAVTPATSPSVLDWTVFVFVVALLSQELYQAFGRGNAFKKYATKLSNVFDIFLVLTFIAYYFLLFVGYYAMDDGFEVIRASFHVLGFASLVSIVRLLSYLQAHSVLGPIQLSFVGIFYDVVLFLIVLGTFLIGFAVCLTSVYSAPVKSLGASPNATLHEDVSGMWSSIKILFWSLFGEFDVSSFEAEPPEEAVGITILALWLVLAVIVLLNMLIALISNSFQRVQNNADIEWKFARAVIICDIWRSPLVPIPMNIFHFVAMFVSYVCCTRFKRSHDFEKCAFDTANHESIREKFREKIAEAEDDGIRRKDLNKLRNHLVKQITTLKAVAFGSKTISDLEQDSDVDEDGSSQSHVTPVQPDDKVYEEKTFRNGLTSQSHASEGDTARDFFEGLRQLQERFQESFQKHQSEIQASLRNLQSEFLESIRSLQSEFLERQAKVAGSTSLDLK